MFNNSNVSTETPCQAMAYYRLSKDDGNAHESDSIQNQRKLIHAYLQNHPYMELVDEAYDDGYTGTNYDRPGFRSVLEAINAGRVNCVIVKDDCVIIELNAKSPIKCGFCAVSSIF